MYILQLNRKEIIMKNSKTTIKELTARYSAILRKCALLNAIAILGIATGAQAYNVTTNDQDLSSVFTNGTISQFDESYTGYKSGIFAQDKNATWTADRILIKDDAATGGAYDIRAVQARGSSVLNLNADSITIDSNAIGVMTAAKDGVSGTIYLRGNDIDIHGTTSALWAQSNSTAPVDGGVNLSLVGNNIKLTSEGQAITALSKGIIDITGNAVIKGETAIVARGDAVVNINKGTTDKTAKIDGNIEFNYDKATSGTKVDATIDVTLNGADSYWKGNTVASYGSGKPADASYLTVSKSTLTMNNGAKWIATKITDSDGDTAGTMYAALNNLNINDGTVEIQDTTRGIFVDTVKMGNGTIVGGQLNVNDSMDVTGTLTLADGVATINSQTGTIHFADGSSLKTNLLADASSTALITAAQITGKTSLIFANGDGEGQVQLKGASAGGFAFNDNALYNITNDATNQDIFIFTRKSAGEIASNTGASGAEADAIIAASQSSADNPLLNQMTQALQSGDTETAKNLANAINPSQAASQQAAANINAIGGAVMNRLFASGPAMVARPAQNGRSGGDIKSKLAPWVQGLYTKTHNTQAVGFDAYSRGFAFGVDSDVTNAVTVGIGYAYTATDIKSTRKTQVYGDNYFVYGQYKPQNWYINGMFSYGHANYKEATVATTAKYNVDNYAAQIMTGYDYGIANNYAGVRYNYIDTETYNNGVADIKTKNAQIGTLVIGTKISKDFKPARGVLLTPEFRLAGTYDVKSDNNSATVAVMGSPSTYSVTGERLSRGAIEAGVGLTANVKMLELSLGYDASVRKRNFSQGGMIKAKYNF